MATSIGDPEGCHIILFTANDSSLAKTRSFRAALGTCFGLGADFGGAVAREPLFNDLGSSDRVFNILSLTPTVYKFRGDGYCAFKWHGMVKADEETRVLLQFHWMPHSSHK